MGDLPYSMADAMASVAGSVSSNNPPKIFYCPGGYTAIQPSSDWWNLSGSSCRTMPYQWIISRDGTQAYSAAGGGCTISSTSSGGGFGSAPTAAPLAAKGFLKKLGVPFAGVTDGISDTEVVADYVLSGPNGEFVHVPTSLTTLLPNGYSSNHMKGSSPGGANTLFMDAHVEWRQFKNMHSPAWVTWGSNHFWF
jgi:prepilin-type processing-associated H-X9-DG protein